MSDPTIPDSFAYRTRALELAERRTRRVGTALDIYRTIIVTVAVIVAAIGAISARDTTRRLDDCLVAGGDCYENLARNGQLGSNRLMDFNGCLLIRLPEDRKETDIAACKKYADDRFFEKLNEEQPGK